MRLSREKFPEAESNWSHPRRLDREQEGWRLSSQLLRPCASGMRAERHSGERRQRAEGRKGTSWPAEVVGDLESGSCVLQYVQHISMAAGEDLHRIVDGSKGFFRSSQELPVANNHCRRRRLPSLRQRKNRLRLRQPWAKRDGHVRVG